jgi:hypothetical protein
MSTVSNQLCFSRFTVRAKRFYRQFMTVCNAKKEGCHTCLPSDTKKRVHLQNVLRQNIRRQNVPATHVTSQLQKVPNTKPQLQKVPKKNVPQNVPPTKLTKPPNIPTTKHPICRTSQASKRSHRIPCTLLDILLINETFLV